MSGEVK